MFLIRSFTNNLKQYDFKKYNIRPFFAALILSIIGIVTITETSSSLARKQVLGLVACVFAFLFFTLLDYHVLTKINWLLYGGVIVILTAVLLFGNAYNNARRWFTLGNFGTIQPSEIGKIFFIVFLAAFIYERRETINKLKNIGIYILLTVIPIVLILREPDLSTSMVYLFIGFVMLFSGGLSWKNVGIMLGITVPLAIFLIWYIQQPNQILFAPHQVERILTFFNPEEYMNSTYAQQYNALLAIGSGMLSGKASTGTSELIKGSSYLSESENDFIFAIVGEKFGFIGCCIVIGLILWIVFECIIIARDAQDLSGRLIATGVGSMLAFQSFINMGVATSLLPNTGLPLPFVSYGLTSLLTYYISIGIVVNVGLQRKRR